MKQQWTTALTNQLYIRSLIRSRRLDWLGHGMRSDYHGDIYNIFNF